MKRTAKYIQQVVDDEPIPPRNFHLFDAIKFVFTKPNEIIKSIIGLMLFLILIYVVWLTKKVHTYDVSYILPFSLIIIFYAFIPIYSIRCLFIASKYGFIGEAEVIEFKRKRNRSVQGKLIVRTRHSNYEQPFYFEDSWVNEIQKGIKFKVIVHPKKDKILFVTGIQQ